MEKIYFFSVIAVAVMISACQKAAPEIQDVGQVMLAFDAEAPSLDPDSQNSDPETKIYHELNPSDPAKHIIKWKKGDQISLMGYVSSTGSYNTGGGVVKTLHNFSANRYTLRYGDGTKSFNGYFPNFAEIYPAVADGGFTAAQNRTTIQMWGTWPATTYECTNENTTPQTDNKFRPITPLGFADVQDGTGWKYAIFLCSPLSSSNKWYNSSIGQPRIDSYYMSPAGGNGTASGIRFRIGCCVARLKLKANKGFVGPVVDMLANTTNFYIRTGCETYTLNLNNGGNLVDKNSADYSDVYFACRGLFGGCHYTFTFTAEDGTTHVKTLVPSSDYTVDVYNLGSFEINDWI